MIKTFVPTHVALAVRGVACASAFYQRIRGAVEVYRTARSRSCRRRAPAT
jgi:catechol 2,3-dioxygenase-like lactoylglutathione lyase family enzyme